MADNVVKFGRPPPEEPPHLAGDAFCTACGHEWPAVAEVGALQLECPSCKRYHGLFKHGVTPDVGEGVWTCQCGNQLFFITDRKTMCRQCGAAQRFP